jgi:hypothetical protein
MEKKDFYSSAHLIVAAIRILEHRDKVPPAVESLKKLLSFSLEEIHLLCRKLQKLDVIEIVEGAFGTKIFIKNHMELEKIPKEEIEAPIKDDIEKFMSSKKDFSKEIESFKAKQEKKQKELFDEIEQKIKEKLKNK